MRKVVINKQQQCQDISIEDSQQDFITVQFVSDYNKNFGVRSHKKNYSSPDIAYKKTIKSFNDFPLQKNKTVFFEKRSIKEISETQIKKQNLQTAHELFYQVQKKRKLQLEVVKRTAQNKNDFYQKLKARIKNQLASLEKNYMVHSQAKKQKIENLKQMMDGCQNKKHIRRINFRRKEESGKTINSNVGGNGYEISPKNKKNQRFQQQQFSVTRASTGKYRHNRQKINSDMSEFEQKLVQNSQWCALQNLNTIRSYKMIPQSASVRNNFAKNSNLTVQKIQGQTQQYKYLSNNFVTQLNKINLDQSKINCIKKHKRNYTSKCDKKKNHNVNFLLTNRINKQKQNQQSSFDNYSKKRPLTCQIRPNKIQNQIKGLLGNCTEQYQNLRQIKKNIDLFGYYCQKLDSKLQKRANNLEFLICKKEDQQQKKIKMVKKVRNKR